MLFSKNAEVHVLQDRQILWEQCLLVGAKDLVIGSRKKNELVVLIQV